MRNNNMWTLSPGSRKPQRAPLVWLLSVMCLVVPLMCQAEASPGDYAKVPAFTTEDGEVDEVTSTPTGDPMSTMTLIKFNDPMARCLDGSPGSMYISNGPPGSTGWIIMHQGGGWCTGLSDCCLRATSLLGTSNYNNATLPTSFFSDYFGLGYLSRDPALNPYMHNFTFVLLNYCDGASFTGALEQPMPDVCGDIDNAPDELFFRGKYIRDAAFAEMASRGLTSADEVVIAGNSAGALAAQIHANYYKRNLPAASRVTGLSDSGVFLDYDTDTASVTVNDGLVPDALSQYHSPQSSVAGRYSSQLQWVFMIQNSTAGVDEACAAQYAPSNLAWRCIFSQYNAAFLEVPFFFLQSIFDSWQLSQIAVPNFNMTMIDRYGGLLRNVVEEQVLDISGERRGRKARGREGEFSRAAMNVEHGVFLESCYHHCGFWGLIAIDGYTTPYAHLAWLNGDRSIFEQVELFPCHDCCTIMHVSKQKWSQDNLDVLSKEEEEEIAADKFADENRAASLHEKKKKSQQQQPARKNPFLKGVDHYLQPFLGHGFP